MKDFEKQFLKNIFAEHNMTNLDYHNHPERLIAVVHEVVASQEKNKTPSKRTIIKKSIAKNESLMKVEFISQNKVITELFRKDLAMQSSSAHEAKSSTDNQLRQKDKIVSIFSRIISHKGGLSGQIQEISNSRTVDNITDLEQKNDRIRYNQTSLKIAPLSEILDSEDGKIDNRIFSSTEKATISAATKTRNMFSATTKDHSQGVQLKARFADQT